MKTVISLAVCACYFFALPAAASTAQAPVDGKALYISAIDTMRQMPDPAYVTFDYVWIQHAGRNVDQTRLRAVERTADQSTIFQGTKGWQAGDVIARPDLFLRKDVAIAPGAPSPNDQTLRIDTSDAAATPLNVIAAVAVRGVSYSISVAGSQSVNGCADAIHLMLAPRGDPHKHNLRELWIDPASHRICKAVAIWRAAKYMWHTFDIAMALELNADGQVVRYTSEGTAHAGPFALQYTEDIRYDALTAALAGPAPWPTSR